MRKNLSIGFFCLFAQILFGQSFKVTQPNDSTVCVAIWGGAVPYLIESTDGFSAITTQRAVCWTSEKGKEFFITVTDARGVRNRKKTKKNG